MVFGMYGLIRDNNCEIILYEIRKQGLAERGEFSKKESKDGK